MKKREDRCRVPATLSGPKPADFPLGSVESRAAARAMANTRNVEDSSRPVIFRATHFEPGRRHDDEPVVIYDYNTNLPIGETKDAAPAEPSQSALDNAVSTSAADSVIVVEILE